jgi:hypothetical protein
MAAVGGAAPVRPEADTGRIPTWQQSYLAEGSMKLRVLRAIGYCAAEGRRNQVEALLRTEPGSPEEDEAVQALDLESYSCLGGTWKMTLHSYPVYRGVLAEFLYKRLQRSPRKKVPLPAAEASTVDLAFAQGSPSSRDQADAVGCVVAACVTTKNPSEAHALITYDSGSVGETRSLRALRPVMLSCLPAGADLRVSRLAIRAMIAEALYQASEKHREFFNHA